MIALSVTAKKEKELSKLLKGKTKQLQKNMKIAVKEVAKKTHSTMIKGVYNELNVTQANIRKTTKVVYKMGFSGSPKAIVTQKKTGRIPLRDFGATQNKKGVAYRVSRSKGKRPVVLGSFQGTKPGVVNPKWRGRVFKRVGKGRLPIVQLFGASPWGVLVKTKLVGKLIKQADEELLKQINRRIRFISLKKSGAI